MSALRLFATPRNGIWLDIPGDRFSHSDCPIFVKIGAGRDHLFSFFKDISVFREKVLPKGIEVGSLTEAEAGDLFDTLPSFQPIPAYICGFVDTHANFRNLDYRGKKGTKNYTITGWNGPIQESDLASIKEETRVTGSIMFEGKGKFYHSNGYLFNAGNLRWKVDDWKRLIGRI